VFIQPTASRGFLSECALTKHAGQETPCSSTSRKDLALLLGFLPYELLSEDRVVHDRDPIPAVSHLALRVLAELAKSVKK
jgi:hypothetical protein